MRNYVSYISLWKNIGEAIEWWNPGDSSIFIYIDIYTFIRSHILVVFAFFLAHILYDFILFNIFLYQIINVYASDKEI